MNRQFDYEQFYCDQAGGGMPVYRGSRYMHGHGFLGRIAKRVAIPLWNFFGKHLAQTGLDVANDVISGRSKFKDSFKTNMRKNAKNAVDDAVPLIKRKLEGDSDDEQQEGSGFIYRQRRRVSRSKRPKLTSKKKGKKSTKKRATKAKSVKRVTRRKSVTRKTINNIDKKFPFFRS